MTAHDSSNERWQERYDALANELADAKREKDNQWNAVKVVTDDIFAAIGDADHVNENINVGVRRVVAERDRLRAALETIQKSELRTTETPFTVWNRLTDMAEKALAESAGPLPSG